MKYNKSCKHADLTEFEDQQDTSLCKTFNYYCNNMFYVFLFCFLGSIYMKKVSLDEGIPAPNQVTVGETAFHTFLCKTQPTVYTTSGEEELSPVPSRGEIFLQPGITSSI